VFLKKVVYRLQKACHTEAKPSVSMLSEAVIQG